MLVYWSMFILKMLPESSEARLRRAAADTFNSKML